MLVMPRWITAPFFRFAIILTLGFFVRSAAFADEPKGIVVVARTAPVALLIWDASPAVADLVIAGHSGDDGLRALEAQAVTLLGARAARARAANIELRVQYAPNGIVGAAYNASTFANESPLFVVKAASKAAAAHASAWATAVAAGQRPAGLGLQITGAFPKSQ